MYFKSVCVLVHFHSVTFFIWMYKLELFINVLHVACITVAKSIFRFCTLNIVGQFVWLASMMATEFPIVSSSPSTLEEPPRILTL